ncbi:LysM peptidoglycan-binding domain-containing protein [Isoptericola sp. F-RaC21]|uniref:LysM peptidoglycan-binding domain-containing protein n=1 Tax=Isoptericola sp. F-RaC21 TaxID=3141452 RepID=UPI00315BA771
MRRLKGFLALLLLIGVTVGVPYLLVAVGANPLEDGLLSPDTLLAMLTSPDDGSLLMLLLQAAAWVAWAFLALSIVVELVAQLRGVRAPRLVGLRLPQNAARGLVAATLLLFTTVPVATTATALEGGSAEAQQSVAAVSVQQAVPGQSAGVGELALDAALASQSAGQGVGAAPISSDLIREARAQAAAEQAAHHERAEQAAHHEQAARTVQHTVEHGDSLWSLAEHYLGDGQRFREIVALNADTLADRPDFLTPGWVLTVPAPAAQERDGAAQDTTAGTVVVEAGDNLSQIAEQELGDADRYPEIFEASRDVAQPGGAHLTDPDLILPGWTLQVPGAEGGADEQAERAVRQDAPAPAAAAASASAADAAPGTATDATPEAGAQHDAAGSARAEVQADSRADSLHAGDDAGLSDRAPWRVAGGWGLGALLAAGVVGLVARRRRDQQRRRLPGQSVPLPSGEEAAFEHEARSLADPLSVERVDVALRALARQCADARRPLPVLRAVRLGEATVELYLAAPAELAAPWGASDPTGTVWSLDRAGVRRLEETYGAGLAQVAAPFPALVTVGHDEGPCHVLLNLETVGTLTVAGDARDAGEVVAALVVELATSAWADDLQVNVVGGPGDDLPDGVADVEGALRTGRVRRHATVGALLQELGRCAEADRRALAQAGATSVGAARAAGVAPDAWSPEIVVLGVPMSEDERARLTALVDEAPRIALASIVHGAAPSALGGEPGWALQVAPGAARAQLAPAGMALRPQRLPVGRLGPLLRLVELSGADVVGDETHLREPSLAEVESVPPAADGDATLDGDLDATDGDLTHVAPARSAAVAPRVCVLGAVSLDDAAGPVDPAERSRLLELAAHLALHPGTTSAEVGAALWPERTEEARAAALSTAVARLRRWLGPASDGRDRLPRHAADDRLALHDVGSDVRAWAALVGDDASAAATEDLERALDLVRGAPFAGSRPRRYAWAEADRLGLSARVVDVACEVARRRVLEGRWRAAERAVAVGLRVEPAHEALWRLRVLAAHESRDPASETAAVHGLLTATESLGGDLTPRTAQLLAALQHPGSEFDGLMAGAL